MKDCFFTTIDEFLMDNAPRFVCVGPKNEAARQIVALCKGTAQSDANLIVLHGLWAHEKALEAGLIIHTFLVCPPLAKWAKIADVSAKFLKIARRCYTISERTFARISDYGDPDGILSLAYLPVRSPEALAFGDNSVVFVMDGLTKPGNIGVILRSCDGAGVSAVMICHLRTRVTHPNAIKASMGAAFSVPLVAFGDACACKAWLKQNGFAIYVADPHAPNRYDNLSYSGKIAIVLGNEHRGASETWYDGSASSLSIPMNGTCDSLNVSVAASILAYEIQSKRAGR